MKNEANSIDGYYLKFSEEIVKEEGELASFCKEIEESWSSDWLAIPWFVENAWFFELLQFEEHLMILIMIPIGLVAAFAIAIALMTSVLRKIREIGLLVAMGAPPSFSGLSILSSRIYYQFFFFFFFFALLGCGLAVVFIYFRDELMSLIV